MRIKKINFRLLITGKIILTLTTLSCSLGTYSQNTIDSLSKMQASINELPAKPFRMPSLQDVGGSPFLSNEYHPGSVELGQGRVVNDVPMKFNTFNNVLMVMREGQELKLEFFEIATYSENDPNGVLKQYRFKAGYPEIDNHNENSIYQVLSMGPKVHLLKFIDQKVEDVPTLGEYSKREIVTNAQYYVYIPGGEMKRIRNLKAGKQSLQEALPNLSDRILEISSSKKLKLKNEGEISTLVEELNKP